MFNMGVDQGNASLKLVGPRPDLRLMVPHALVRDQKVVRNSSWQVDGDPLDFLHCQITSTALSNQTTEIIAGSLAIREYPDRCEEVHEGELKSSSERHNLLALVALAAGVHTMDAQVNHAKLSIAVSLPMAEYANREHRIACQQQFVGLHQVQWDSTPRWQGRRVTLDIKQADVVPEGAIAYAALCARKPTWAPGVTLVVDIGARSIDWATFGAGGKFQSGLSGGTLDGGIALVADRILANSRQVHGPQVGRGRLDVLQSLQRFGLGEKSCQLYGRGKAFDCTELATFELDRLASDVARIITGVLERIGRVDHLAVIGGGGALLRPYLEPLVDFPVHVPDGAEWLNAEGLHTRARLSQ